MVHFDTSIRWCRFPQEVPLRLASSTKNTPMAFAPSADGQTREAARKKTAEFWMKRADQIKEDLLLKTKKEEETRESIEKKLAQGNIEEFSERYLWPWGW